MPTHPRRARPAPSTLCPRHGPESPRNVRHPRPSHSTTCRLTLSQPARPLPLPGRRAADGRRRGAPHRRAEAPRASGSRGRTEQRSRRGARWWAGPPWGQGRETLRAARLRPPPPARNGTARPRLKPGGGGAASRDGPGGGDGGMTENLIPTFSPMSQISLCNSVNVHIRLNLALVSFCLFFQ